MRAALGARSASSATDSGRLVSALRGRRVHPRLLDKCRVRCQLRRRLGATTGRGGAAHEAHHRHRIYAGRACSQLQRRRGATRREAGGARYQPPHRLYACWSALPDMEPTRRYKIRAALRHASTSALMVGVTKRAAGLRARHAAAPALRVQSVLPAMEPMRCNETGGGVAHCSTHDMDAPVAMKPARCDEPLYACRTRWRQPSRHGVMNPEEMLH